jgi:hypothetical protein
MIEIDMTEDQIETLKKEGRVMEVPGFGAVVFEKNLNDAVEELANKRPDLKDIFSPRANALNPGVIDGTAPEVGGMDDHRIVPKSSSITDVKVTKIGIPVDMRASYFKRTEIDTENKAIRISMAIPGIIKDDIIISMEDENSLSVEIKTTDDDYSEDFKWNSKDAPSTAGIISIDNDVTNPFVKNGINTFSFHERYDVENAHIILRDGILSIYVDTLPIPEPAPKKTFTIE